MLAPQVSLNINGLVTCLLTFKASVPSAEINSLIDELKAMGGEHVGFHIRQGSRDTHSNTNDRCVGFQHYLTVETYHTFFNRVTHLLKRRFGNDVTWSFSPWTKVVQPLSPTARLLASIWWEMQQKAADPAEHDQIGKMLQVGCMRGDSANGFILRLIEAVAFAYEALGLMYDASPEPPVITDDIPSMEEITAIRDYRQWVNVWNSSINSMLEGLYGEDVAPRAFEKAQKMHRSTNA